MKQRKGIPDPLMIAFIIANAPALVRDILLVTLIVAIAVMWWMI